MKKITILLTGIAALALVLAGCFSPYTGNSGDKGSITIALGGTSKAPVNPDTELASMRHEITLRGPGGTITRTVVGGGIHTIEAAPGNWTVKVRARGPKPAFYEGLPTDSSFPGASEENMLRAMGETTVTVTAGANASADITMISATEVDTWMTLETAVKYANTVEVAGEFDPVPGEEIIVLTANMSFTAGSGTLNLDNSRGKITLMADRDVTIKRGYNGTNFFEIHDGTLTLGRPGMTGTITFDGGYDRDESPPISGDSFAAVVIVDGEGQPSLIMNDGVILTNNYNSSSTPVSGGEGGAVFVNGGSFTMNGGIISNNVAEAGRGGGVCIIDGKFTMNGGIIRRNSAGNEISTAGNGGGVYIYKTNNVLEDVYFIKNGGTIYGDNNPSDANTVASYGGAEGAGDAVCYTFATGIDETPYESKYRENTLDETDNLSTNNLTAKWDRPD